MKGKEWQEAMSNRTVEQLTELNNALAVLSEDPESIATFFEVIDRIDLLEEKCTQ